MFEERIYYIIFAAVVGLAYYLFGRKKTATGATEERLQTRKLPTPFLNMYTIDFTSRIEQGRIDPVIGRAEEVEQLSRVLSRRRKNNALLVGDPGVGKTAVVEGLAQRIVQGKVPDNLEGKRVLSLEVSSLMAGTKYRGEFEERAKKIIEEIKQSGRG